ncbi:hypothetical protein KUTeg_023370 [Tegillarca granosa]|uniref:Receptor ligand binding region domain-containing protein n=1 Tax=Tegillarca granosa TaxID=220873 RepID=A0ABQ9E718_TEGGR|nr:hypothetical protein KUTeg_023370 [Tegillarca granosa]
MNCLNKSPVVMQTKFKHQCAKLTANALNQIKGQSLFVSYAIEATVAMTKSIKTIHGEKCGNNIGICQRLNEVALNYFYNKLHNLEYSLVNDLEEFNLSRLYQTQESEFENKKIGNSPVYGVYNYQMINSSSGNNFDFKKHFLSLFYIKEKIMTNFECLNVGHFQNQTLELFKNNLKFYKADGSEIFQFPVAQCEAGKQCKKCQKIKERTFYIPGDYIVVVEISIHDKGKTFLSCSEIRQTIGLELALGAVYIVNKFNQKKSIYSKTFLNKTIGVLVIDTCNDPLLIQRQVLNLQENNDIYSRILGFVGDIGSSSTVKFAEVTGALKHPHVGFASTTYLLTDRNKFPFFARVSMEMAKQAEGMVQMAELIGANYVQIIYSSGEYGEAGKLFIQEFVRKYSICIAQTPIEVPEGSTYYNILPRLRKKPHARVVFVILRSHVGPAVMKSINEEMTAGEFLFIGTEAWGSRSDYLKLNLEGSISFSQYLQQDPDFELFLQRQKPQVTEQNPWLLDFFQKRLNCYFPWSFDKTMSRECNDADLLTSVGTLDPWIPYMMRAVESLLFGTDVSLKMLCGENGGICEEYRRNPSLVMKNIRDVRLNDKNVFSSKGDGTLGYTIYNIQKDQNNPLLLVYKKCKVGTLTANGRLEVTKRDLANIGEPSLCPNSQACDCNGNNTEISSSESGQNGYFYPTIVLAAVISFTILVGLIVIIVKYCRLYGICKDKTYLNATHGNDVYEDPNHLTHM